MIPISLAIVHLLMVFGPVNGFMVSRMSQQNRLEKLLTKNQLFDGTKIVSNPKPIEKTDAEQIRSIVSYLVKANNINDVSPLCGIDLIAIEKYLKNDLNYDSRFEQYKIADSVLSLLNVSSVPINYIETYFNCVNEDIVYETNGAKYLLKRESYLADGEKVFEFNNEKLVSYHADKSDILWIEYQNKKYVINTKKLKSDLLTLKQNEPNNNYIRFDKYIIPLVNGDDKIELRLLHIRLNYLNNFESIAYYILVK